MRLTKLKERRKEATAIFNSHDRLKNVDEDLLGNNGGHEHESKTRCRNMKFSFL